MKRLLLRSVNIPVKVQEYTPDKEQDYLELIAYEPSDRLKRIRQHADNIRREEWEKLIAL